MTIEAQAMQPPAEADLTWRALAASDLAAIAAITAACLDADGGLPLASTADFIQGRYLSGPAHASIGAFDPAGRLAACTAAQLAESPQEYRGLIVCQVHPGYRQRGLGMFLLRWSVERARALLADCPADRPHTICVSTESLTAAADRLYARHSLAQQFGEIVMRRDLHAPLPSIALPPDITLETWTPALAEQFFAAYQESFRARPGFPGWSAREWIEWVADDDTFLPDLSLLARRAGRPIGFIVCGEDWIIQVGVRPADRGQGIAAALVAEALRRFRVAGGASVMLDVNMNNPIAERLYARLGFVVIGRRARYVAPA